MMRKALIARAGTTGQVFELKLSPMGNPYLIPLEASKERLAYCAGPLLQDVTEGDYAQWYSGLQGKDFGWRKVK